MKQLNPYQVNFLMAMGMAITAVPALLIKEGKANCTLAFKCATPHASGCGISAPKP